MGRGDSGKSYGSLEKWSERTSIACGWIKTSMLLMGSMPDIIFLKKLACMEKCFQKHYYYLSNLHHFTVFLCNISLSMKISLFVHLNWIYMLMFLKVMSSFYYYYYWYSRQNSFTMINSFLKLKGFDENKQNLKNVKKNFDMSHIKIRKKGTWYIYQP